MFPIVFVLILIALTIYLLWPKKKKHINTVLFNNTTEDILIKKVPFYKNLDQPYKEKFKVRILSFLESYSIDGIETEVDNELKLLIACSAIIPVFHFPSWEYFNLSEIIVYEKLVDSYEIKENKQTNIILGQVRPFQTKHIVLLSKQSILKAFSSDKGNDNLGIHEFVHLVDEADGEIDGIPKAIIPQELFKPWSHLMYKEIEKIKHGSSDINPYGVTNHGEFFAVVSEYFFENPTQFEGKHPELYLLLSKVFRKK